MNIKEILNKEIPNKDKESQIATLLSFRPPREEPCNDEYYSGLPQEALSTSFLDYYTIYKDLKGDLVDYGAGYCKGTLLFKLLGEKNCFSYEVLKNRVDYTKKLIDDLKLKSDQLYSYDLLKEEIPLADNYLVYLPLGSLIFRLMNALYKSGRPVTFYVIESHGDVLNYLHALNCMKLEKVMSSFSKRHIDGIHKFIFDPKAVKDTLYSRYFTQYDFDKSYKIKEEDRHSRFNFSKSLPIFYNESSCIEMFEHKRILDNRVIKLDENEINIV
jgi:hypothetical protein